jgi:hypothetical protein
VQDDIGFFNAIEHQRLKQSPCLLAGGSLRFARDDKQQVILSEAKNLRFASIDLKCEACAREGIKRGDNLAHREGAAKAAAICLISSRGIASLRSR